MNYSGLDAIDNKILNLLTEDARLSYSDIASEVNISIVVVKNRIKDMEDREIILGYKTIINSSNASLTDSLGVGKTNFVPSVASEKIRIYWRDIYNDSSLDELKIQRKAKLDTIKKSEEATLEKKKTSKINAYEEAMENYRNKMEDVKRQKHEAMEEFSKIKEAER